MELKIYISYVTTSHSFLVTQSLMFYDIVWKNYFEKQNIHQKRSCDK